MPVSGRAEAFLPGFFLLLPDLLPGLSLGSPPAARAAVCINAIPLITTFGAWLVLDERLTVMQGVGGAIVVGAVYLANYSPDQQKKKGVQEVCQAR